MLILSIKHHILYRYVFNFLDILYLEMVRLLKTQPKTLNPQQVCLQQDAFAWFATFC